MSLLTEMPARAAADLVGEHDTRLWWVLHHYVQKAHSARSNAGVGRARIDETSSRRGQDYISVFADLQVPRVPCATEGLDHDTVGLVILPDGSERLLGYRLGEGKTAEEWALLLDGSQCTGPTDSRRLCRALSRHARATLHHARRAQRGSQGALAQQGRGGSRPAHDL